jgi:hypothetical protein
MAEFKFDRFKYTWKGNWAGTTAYLKDDVVHFNGSSYVCIVAHTSTANFYAEFLKQDLVNNVPNPFWVKMTEGYVWNGPWLPNNAYQLGDIVTVNGNVYICINNHTSGIDLIPTDGNWTIYLDSTKFRQDWESFTLYEINDIVRYGGTVYRCIESHTSSSLSTGLEGNLARWEVYYSGVDYRGEYSANTKYKLNDLVVYKATVLRCTTAYTSDNLFDETKWTIELPGELYQGEWSASTYYSVGNIVRSGGYLYYSLTNNINSHPNAAIYDLAGNETPDWEVLSKGINFVGTWDVTVNYKAGDVVRRGGSLYVALVDTEIAADGSSLDYLDLSNWELLTTGYNYAGNWSATVSANPLSEIPTYAAGDIVRYIGNTYRALVEHVPSEINAPDTPILGATYWELILKAGPNTALQFEGDLLTYGFDPDNYGDFDTLQTTNVEIGLPGQLLHVGLADLFLDPVPAPPLDLLLSLEKKLEYKSWGVINRLRYVGLSGVDDDTDPERGRSPFKPWRTIRFAADRLNDGFDGTTTISVGVGVYEEILPIIVPANTVVLGSELRSTVVKASGPIARLVDDYQYTRASLIRLIELIENIVVGNPIVKTIGNPLEQVLVGKRPIQVPFNPPQYDIPTGAELFDTQLVDVVGSGPAGVAVRNLIEQIVEYIDLFLGNVGSLPSLFGSNNISSIEGFVNASYILEANKEFLAEEAVAFIALNFPSYKFEGAAYIREYIRAMASDVQYTSNYKSILAARIYKNSVLGSTGEDMFYCRDNTGVRDMTISGLVGTITEQPVRYQDTIGPSYISLDPGWGPDHEACWIVNRSPYIQGVTTLGYAAVGQKIDGALHNGGNRSIVSNDFTQVISDGYGAWVTNNGRAELVSVFSYYANVGYLATNGGIIRATNGNNSYGNFGAVADGRDNTEIPITGNVDNRLNEATIAGTIVSSTGAILLLEYNNAGQGYTNAALTLVGSGAAASAIFDEFRDNAVFDVKPIDTAADEFSTLNPIIRQEIGGSGYTVAQGNAQPHVVLGGDATGITLAVNDDNIQSQYLGMRIIIIGGPGTGQYGYVTAYNSTNKQLLVSRESDDQPGWDNVIPGTPGALFTTGTTYRIEPRVIFDDPGFDSEEITVPTSNIWGAVVYGETSGEYLNVPASFGSGNVESQDGLVPISATFDVVKTGRLYSATINNPGAGYTVGDLVFVSGDLLDGVESENNLIIEVTQVSDDSTNSIVDFETSGVASSGVFVIFPESGNQLLYSFDATEWGTSTMPSSGQWTNLASGEAVLVAIKSNASNTGAAYSLNGINWVASTLPTSATWTGVVYGGGKFVAISNNNSAAYSLDGIAWVASTMPTVGDSTVNTWTSITYGRGRFVAVANTGDVAAYSADGISWTGTFIDDSGNLLLDWISVVYGNGRYVAVATNGQIAYSLNGEDWTISTTLLSNGAQMQFQKIKYAQGLFLAICRTSAGGSTTAIFKSTDGIVWAEEQLTSSLPWKDIAFGNPDLSPVDSSLGSNTPIWLAVGGSTNRISNIRTGKRAEGRCVITGGRINGIKLWDPGSGYLTAPDVSLVAPFLTEPAVFRIRIADGALANPSWANRGIGYLANTLTATITGDGVADVIPVGKLISLSNLSRLPTLGSQIEFIGDSTIYTIVTRTQLSNGVDGITARFRINPELRVRNAFFHDQPVLIRERVSQIRLTGHDFLDIGTGNFEQTNYPEIYATGLFNPDPENEIDYLNGGVVFYTSTDQLGNYRVGELFQVEQATGIVTLSADFFDLAGLSELRLGGIRIGGTGTVIREFSTDTLFSADSNNTVPTQRAIARYLGGRLTVGGSEIATASFIAGTTLVGPNVIRNTANLNIIVPVRVDFTESSTVVGTMIAQTFFYSSFRERPDL